MKNIVLFLLLIISFSYSNEIESKKVLYINSYHEGYTWSDGIEKVIKSNLNKSKLNIELKIFRMDSKRNKSKNFIEKKALEAKRIIEEYKPDVVIVSDDNAVKYLLVPYFNNSSIPFIFCGVNGSSKKYNLSKDNTTGMIEVKLVLDSIKNITKFTKGNKIAYLNDNTISAKKDGVFFENVLNKSIKKVYVNTLKQWKDEFLNIQNNADILFFGYPSGINDWTKSKAELKKFIKLNTKIPSTSWNASLKELTLLTFAMSSEEQGDWASKKTIEILKGKKINQIPVTKNKKGDIYINLSLSKKLGITFPFDLVDNSTLVQ